jgi:hypothetical protein
MNAESQLLMNGGTIDYKFWLRRPDAALILALSVLCLISVPAYPQIYVAQYGKGTVSEYNSDTGAAINAQLIPAGPNPVPLSGPAGLALSGNTLFVANSGSNTIGKYTVNATTVTQSTPAFISTGLSTPVSVAVAGGHLFVVSQNGNQAISEYDADKGTLQKASFLPPSTTQVGAPIAIAASSNYLFVAHYQEYTYTANNYGFGSVGQYDINSGALVNERLIKGLVGPIGLTVSGSTLYVVSSGYAAAGAGSVGKYDATTGAPINVAFITGLIFPQAVSVFGEKIFVSIKNSGLGSVGFYDAGGVLDKTHSVSGVLSPYGLAVGTATTPLSPTHILFYDNSINKTVDATQSTQSVVVGQQIKLSADPVGSGPWEVIDSANHAAKLVGGYTTPTLGTGYPSSDAKSEATVTPANLSGAAGALFYFVTPDLYTVMYHYTGADGKAATAPAKFEVDGPGATVTPSPTPGIYKPLQPVATSTVTYSVPIQFYLTKVAAKSHPGNFFWTQLVDKETLTSKNTVDTTVKPEPTGLDNAFPYAGGLTVYPFVGPVFSSCYNSDTRDEPYAHLPSGNYSFNEVASFRMYLMWEWSGSAPNTIPVSLGYLPWSFNITILMNGAAASLDPSGPNQVQVGSFVPVLSNTIAGEDFPQWDSVAVPDQPNSVKITPCGKP